MADPVSQKLVDVEKFLEKLAVPKASNLPNGTAAPQPLLAIIASLLTTLYSLGTVGPAAKTVGADLAKGMKDAVTALRKVAGILATISGTAADTAAILTSLQSALSVAQTLVPGSSPALTSGSQFFGMIGTLVTDAGGVAQAANVLYELAQEIDAIADALKPV
jgi:hypothetical protein